MVGSGVEGRRPVVHNARTNFLPTSGIESVEGVGGAVQDPAPSAAA